MDKLIAKAGEQNAQATDLGKVIPDLEGAKSLQAYDAICEV